MATITSIEGIGKVYGKKLADAGVATVEVLLEQGASPPGRKGLEEKTGIPHKLIRKWVDRADLSRIKGVGEQYSDLLQEAGVETVVELAQRDPEHLFAKLTEISKSKHLVRVLPTREHVADWIRQAKRLPRVVTY
jgi:predicted flap endonuclease-1-like 5' DNA nuclease